MFLLPMKKSKNGSICTGIFENLEIKANPKALGHPRSQAGKSGTLKSLHLFLREKALFLGVRFYSDLPSLLESETALADGRNIPYRLLSLPLYMVEQVRRLIRQTIKS